MAVDASLARLQTDYIDLYQLYKPSRSVVESGAFLEVLEEIKASGKIRHYGLACATVDDTMPGLGHPGISAVQVAVNLLDQDACSSLIPTAGRQGVAVVARYPRAAGMLTTAGWDVTGDTSQFSEEEFARRQRRAQSFRFLVRPDRTLAQAALQFVLQLRGISTLVPRAVSCDELSENLGALNAAPLSSADLSTIEELCGPAGALS
jgi:aryl-alcohol dehydrogenase-like predicted oxidoreductase